MNSELIESLDLLAKEKGIDRESIFEAIENALVAGCRNLYGRNENCGGGPRRIENDRGPARTVPLLRFDGRRAGLLHEN